jgi:hypothetical protein
MLKDWVVIITGIAWMICCLREGRHPGASVIATVVFMAALAWAFLL